jgi:N-acetyl-alpha-D-muramate 1-phosphate uridylyltransferase|tara:strand:- start:458 stop:1153 length:696 start_codon:yes stop_codon:yes gene_type:complete
MKIKYGMILAAGLGKRMQPITLKTPKPLIQIGDKNLLDRAICFLINYGVDEIVINVHYLADQIKNFINKKKYKTKITIFHEQEMLLNTGGGVLNATKSFKEPFVVVNPDTLWSNAYLSELRDLENLYFQYKKTCLLLVNKNLSFDSSFKGDFNLQEGVVSRDNDNELIFTGLQILDHSVFSSTKDKVFSMNNIWNKLIANNSLNGMESNQKFYHLNTKEIYDKILSLNITD